MAFQSFPAALAILASLALVGCKDDKGDDDSGVVGVDADGDGYVTAEDGGDDCDDYNDTVHPGAEEACDGLDNDCNDVIDDDLNNNPWYYDGDGDGYGDDAISVEACAQPEGYAEASGDCDDADTDFYPGAPEDDCTDPNDYNCDGSVGYADLDGDRYPACLECDDTNSAIYPGATETCNGADDDCDGTIDNDASDATTWFIDYDTDGYGSDRYTILSCEQPAGFVSNSDDCNDANDDAYPGTDEVCDGTDTDCDGEIDEDSAVDALTWYLDEDGDGYGIPDSTTVACNQPEGYAEEPTDCDDADLEVHPDADEVCNGKDDDCDGDTDDDDALDATTWYADADDDGYGLDDFVTVACEQPESYADIGGDCYDDGTDFGATINPEGTEVCDDYDNNCDGTVDENEAEDATEWYQDNDNDGYGSTSAATSACAQPAGYVDNEDDCDDDDDEVNPGADEICNDGIDSNCDDVADGCWMEVSDADTILYGEGANSSTGSAVARAGDVNGDTYEDIVIGAARYDTTVTDVGAAYLAYGPISSGERSIGESDVKIVGAGTSSNDDRAGSSVAGAGDLDGDGIDDLLIGAIRYPLASPRNRGAVYALFGPLTGELDLGSDYQIRFVGQRAFDRLGTGVLGDVDLDGDGDVDIALGANGWDGGGDGSGAVYIDFGPFSETSTDFNASSMDVEISGGTAGDAIGADMAAVEDMDGDGLPELVVGNREYDDDTLGADVGCVYLLSDPDEGEYSIEDVAEAIVGEASEDAAGSAVASAGDANDDGYGDLVVGALGSDESNEDAGKAYLLYGPVTYASLQYAEAHFLGASASDAFGSSVAGNGDNDNDGEIDLLIGASSSDGVVGNGGAAYLYLGPFSAGTLTASDAYAAVYGDALDAALGSRVLFSGDTDGSGNDDILVGAENDNRGGSSAGAVFLFNELGL